ncbi:flagellar biosynthesis protein FlhF [Mobilitalea sibirica]|uniref:Flagellar biosynthesis protein FlhF n=1 Tax=Mobilitalea sibirica TaxID=1462919 RepID=A0A8J7KU28_9FIRM|nr:flagellar biosynthesis protein FlhF [Mobilitalea sibirica]MBH1942006.1 flagellar biosynthesis protein FlhF [Mobilitalea sibirica]
MIIKKFQANTETEAIMLAKEELGKDAIVMNIKTISPKGIYKLFRKPLVEITAAVDDNITYKNEKPKTTPVKPPLKTILPDIIYDEPKEPIGIKTILEDSSEPSAIEQKLNNLQSLLEKQINEKTTEDKTDGKAAENNKNLACIQLIYNQLISNEVEEKYANQIISEIEGTLKKDASMDNILGSIYQKIVLKLGQPKTIDLSGKRPKFVFFIGPTGVGKTTTIAKIASKYKVEEKSKVAFLTADTYRIAAVEQLRTYANILGIPLKVIYTGDEMKEAQEEFSEYDIVFVDTAGRCHRNKDQRDDIEALIHMIPETEREIYLVLSATTKYRDLVKITEVYSEIMNYNLIFTKLDETSSIGNLFNIRMLTQAPLSYATFGQNVPDDISRIDAQSIAKQLLRGQ